MAISLELREKHKMHLISLLKIKRAGVDVRELREELENAVGVMEPEDVAYCEKIIGEKAL